MPTPVLGLAMAPVHLMVPSKGPARNRAAYRRHELAHCNGWDHANSGASGPAHDQDPLKAIR